MLIRSGVFTGISTASSGVITRPSKWPLKWRTPNSIASRFVGASVKNFVGRLEVEAASGTMIDKILNPADFLRGDGSEIHSFGKKLT